MRALALLALSAAVMLASGCARDDDADLATPPADTAPMTPSPTEPAPAPTPSETPPPPDTTSPDVTDPDATMEPGDTGTTPPPPAQ